MNPIEFFSLMAVIAAASACGGGGGGAKTDAGACRATYPAGPYGTAVGATIDDLTLAGSQHYTDGTPVDPSPKTIKLDGYRADPSVKVLAILVAAEWCVPCQSEQAEVVPAYNNYKTNKQGVAILEAITQKQDTSPADQGTIDTWAKHFKIPFDLTADTSGALAPYSNPQLFPSQLVITTCDMKIQWTHNGYDPGTLENAIDAALSL